MRLTEAIKMQGALTENEMATNTTSLNSNVDMFFKGGAMRAASEDAIIATFSKAWNEDPNIAIKVLFWIRDIRGGAGERRFFRIAMSYLAEKDPLGLVHLISLIPEYGRWDDLMIFEGTQAEKYAFSVIENALNNKNGLCAKWMPRKGSFATKLRGYLGFTPKEYRKTLVSLTKVVESQMCAKDWNSIEFGKLPSVASARYQNAFKKNAADRYSAYILSLQKGDAKINAGAVYPYDVIKSLKKGEKKVAIEQWKALPNYLEGSTERILPIVDVSGSMESIVGGNVTCMDVSLSLGLYLSERNVGPFKDHFITFSGTPELQHVTGDLYDRYRQMKSSAWGMNTNLEAVYKLILNQAVKHKVPQNEMPTQLLILSDMEFDQATGSGWYDSHSNWNPTAQEMARKMFTDAGYEMPNIVYWNIQSRGTNVPVRFDETGTALVSGFSPAIMKSLLSGNTMTPVGIMMETINSERYSPIVYETNL